MSAIVSIRKCLRFRLKWMRPKRKFSNPSKRLKNYHRCKRIPRNLRDASRGVSTSIQGLNQPDQLLLHLFIQLHELNAHAWKQKVSLRLVADPGDLRLRFQLVPRPIRKRKFDRQLGTRTERSTTLDEEPAAA